jgi:DNA-binding transcriptional LysR family regulator
MKPEIPVLGRRIDLNLVGIFDAVYRVRNLTAAGRALGLSQPAMSHALSRLRWAFDDPLFVRLPRGLQPTPLADEIAPGLAQGLAAIHGSFERTTFDPQSSTRLFTVSMADIGEVVHLPRVINAVAEAAPNVRLRTVELAPADARAALANGTVDVALAVSHRAGAQFHEVPINEHGYATVVRPDHPEIRRRPTLAQFRKASHLLVIPKGPTQHGTAVEQVLTKARAKIAVRVAHFHSVSSIVMNTDLVATIPRGLADALGRMVGLRVFDPPVAMPRVRVSLYWHERYDRDPGNA